MKRNIMYYVNMAGIALMIGVTVDELVTILLAGSSPLKRVLVYYNLYGEYMLEVIVIIIAAVLGVVSFFYNQWRWLEHEKRTSRS